MQEPGSICAWIYWGITIASVHCLCLVFGVTTHAESCLPGDQRC